MVGMKISMQASLLLCATFTALLSQNFAISSTTYEDQKHYYSPDPSSGRPPSAHHSPPHGSSGSGGGGHGSTTPSHGGGGHGSTSPPANCGNPPSGGHYTPRPNPPSGGGGSYYNSPPPTTPVPYPPTTPTTPTYPTTPTTPTTPIPPAIFTPPSTPSIVSPPTTPPFDPNSPPFPCVFWRNHPTLVWGLLGWWGTVGGLFGGVTAPGFAPSMTVQDALANNRADGIGALYREGTASLLNSMSNNNRFPYTTKQVRDRFISALSSDNAAAAQARLFKLANEGRLPRA